MLCCGIVGRGVRCVVLPSPVLSSQSCETQGIANRHTQTIKVGKVLLTVFHDQ